jgi:hypothetical protein
VGGTRSPQRFGFSTLDEVLGRAPGPVAALGGRLPIA